MRGFPNQVADLGKLALGMNTLVKLVDEGADARDDSVFGEALVRAGVAGTGHVPMPVEDYLKAQRKKTKSNQSFRTTARGLRELYRLMTFINDSAADIEVSEDGRRAASLAGHPLDAEQIEFWRRIIRNISHTDNRGTAYPYQVLLQLVARKPGITRAKCALALEAANNSAEELERVVALVDLSEEHILDRIGETKSNWDNAKKVLPRFAEQLGDVIRSRGSFVIADAPGQADESKGRERAVVAAAIEAAVHAASGKSSTVTARKSGPTALPPGAPRVPRAARKINADMIGSLETDKLDEVDIPSPDLDPIAAAEAIKLRLTRLRRHNAILNRLAAKLMASGAEVYYDTFDLLALQTDLGVLVEVKTLDGSEADERDRVRDALAQLLYYESFVTRPVAGAKPIRKIACFEGPISEAHRGWLNSQEIGAIWEQGDRFVGDGLSATFLRDYLAEFR